MVDDSRPPQKIEKVGDLPLPDDHPQRENIDKEDDNPRQVEATEPEASLPQEEPSPTVENERQDLMGYQRRSRGSPGKGNSTTLTDLTIVSGESHALPHQIPTQ